MFGYIVSGVNVCAPYASSYVLRLPCVNVLTRPSLTVCFSLFQSVGGSNTHSLCFPEAVRFSLSRWVVVDLCVCFFFVCSSLARFVGRSNHTERRLRLSKTS